MKNITINTKTDIFSLSVNRIPKKGERVYIKNNFYVITEITTIFNSGTEIYELEARKS